MAMHEKEIEGYVLDGMARALWVHAYMIWATEVEPPPIMGGSWDEMATDSPGTRRASMQAAQALQKLLAEANGLRVPAMAALFGLVRLGRRWPGGTEADHAYGFGRDLALLSLGVLDRGDSIVPSAITVPRFRVELDDDGRELSWDGGVIAPDGQHALNPARLNPAKGITALLLEDDPMVQKASTRMIKRAYGPNTEVIVVDNVDAGIATLRVHPEIVAVVSDVDVLGDKSGVELFRWVQQNLPHLVDHYMFFTGGHPEVAEIHYRYLEKPAMPDDFRKAMREPPPSRAASPPRSARSTGAPMALSDLANSVRATFPSIRSTLDAEQRVVGRVGSRRVFISAVWRILQNDPRFRGMSLDTFKRHLLEANRESMLSLARADSQGDMNPEELKQSEIRDQFGSFHLIEDPNGRY